MSDKEAIEKEISDLNESFADLSVRDLFGKEESCASSVYSSTFLAGYINNSNDEVDKVEV